MNHCGAGTENANARFGQQDAKLQGVEQEQRKQKKNLNATRRQVDKFLADQSDRDREYDAKSDDMERKIAAVTERAAKTEEVASKASEDASKASEDATLTLAMGFETAERVAWRVDELADEMKFLKAEVADTKALANGLAAATEADRTIGKGQHRG